MPRIRKNKVSDVIPKQLQRAINDLKQGPRIVQAELSLPDGYSYWWFLEYGTGAHHESPDGDGWDLQPPEEVEGETASGGPYDIESGGDHYLVYMSHGKRFRRKSTIHPGIKPVAMVRTALFEAQLFLQEDLHKLADRKNRLLTRKEVVDTVNYIMQVLLGELRLLTPDDNDPDPFHTHRPHTPPLAKAWRVSKAR